jgi:hypothetical protein
MFGVCMCLFCVCVVLCLGRGLATSWSLVKGVQPSVKWSWNWKTEARAQGGCRVTEKKIFEKECSYWRQVLKCIDAAVKLLIIMTSLHRSWRVWVFERKGSLLACLEYLAESDNCLEHHLENYRYVILVWSIAYLIKFTTNSMLSWLINSL